MVTFIGADGNVYTCCNQAYMKKGLMGHIYGSFKEFWLSDKKRGYFKNHNPRKMCQNMCVHRHKNDVMNYSIMDKPRHMEFI